MKQDKLSMLFDWLLKQRFFLGIMSGIALLTIAQYFFVNSIEKYTAFLYDFWRFVGLFSLIIGGMALALIVFLAVNKFFESLSEHFAGVSWWGNILSVICILIPFGIFIWFLYLAYF